MGGTAEGQIPARQDDNVSFYAAEPDDLDRVVSVPQAFDNQWVPDDLLQQVMAPQRRMSDARLEARRLPSVRREYLRGLVNTGQLVINRAFLYNNPAIYQDYATPGRGREDFKKLINDRVVIPYLYSEPSPATPPDFTRRTDGWTGWSEVIAESVPTCLRLSWESDDQNTAQTRRLLATPTAQFIKNIDDIEVPLLGAELGLPAAAADPLAGRLREIAAWAHRRSQAGEGLNREDVYQKFVVADGTNPGDRRYDPSKPFAATIKQLIDLRYNANLTDALGSYLLTPENSPRRRALQEWRSDTRSGGIADADRLVRVMSNLRFDEVQAVLGALAAFEQLSLGAVVELRAMPAWHRYHEVLRAFLAEPSLDVFSDPDHGAQEVALAYSQVIRDAGAIAVRESGERIQRRWDPVIEIMVEFAGAVVSIYYNIGGDGRNAFHVGRGLLPGVATRTAKAVFHLVIGRVTRSHGRARVDNNLRVLETRLDHGRRDWTNFIADLERAGFRELSSIPANAHHIAAMEKSPDDN